MPNYGDKNYREERYDEQNGTTFDWLEDYESIKPIIDNLGIKKDFRILNVGCGNSEFSEKCMMKVIHIIIILIFVKM